MFSYLLANKLKFKLENSSNNSINLIKNSEDNVTLNNNIKFRPHIVSKMNKNLLENKIINDNSSK